MKKLSTLVLSIITSFIASNLMAQCGPGGCGVYGGGGGGYYNNHMNDSYMGHDGHPMNYGDGSYNASYSSGYGDHYNDGGYYGSPSYNSSYGTQYNNSSSNQQRPFPRSNNRKMGSQVYSFNETQPNWSNSADDHGHVAEQYAPQYGFADYGNSAPTEHPNDNHSSNGPQSYPGSHN